jgi:hypothetical protein
MAEEKLNQAGHKLINPEKHLHVHPVFRPKQYSYPDLLACIPVVLPNSKFVESFDFVMSFLLVYIAIIAPVDMAFLEPKYDALFVFNRTIDCYFLMDFALQFNLATPSACLVPLTPSSPKSDEPVCCSWPASVGAPEPRHARCGRPDQYGRLLIDRREIADKYIHGWMLIDLLSLVPFDLLVMLGLFAGLDQIKARLFFHIRRKCIDMCAVWVGLRAGRTDRRNLPSRCGQASPSKARRWLSLGFSQSKDLGGYRASA